MLVENKAIVEFLLEAGADANIAGESEYHLTPLISAIVKPPMKEIEVGDKIKMSVTPRHSQNMNHLLHT